jgi:hypothetical protein
VSFTYTVKDNAGATSNAATVTITVTAGGGHPLASSYPPVASNSAPGLDKVGDRNDITILLAYLNPAIGTGTCGVACELAGDNTVSLLDLRHLPSACTGPGCAVW